MSRRTVIQTAILSLLLLSTSCAKEWMIDDGRKPLPDVPEGMVRLELFTDGSNYEQPATRAGSAEEGKLNPKPWVLVFKDTDGGTAADSTFVEVRQAEAFVNGKSTVVLSETTEPEEAKRKRRLLIIGNATKFRTSNSTELPSNDEGYDFSTANLEKLLKTEPRKTIEFAVKNLLTAPLLTGDKHPTVPYTTTDKLIPMSADYKLASIVDTTKIGTDSDTLKLRRVVAKVTVATVSKADNGNIGDFVLHGATVVDAPRDGALCYLSTDAVRHVSTLTDYLKPTSADPEGVDGIAPADKVVVAPEDTITTTNNNPIYLYESPAGTDVARNVSVIIRGTYKGRSGYYRLAFVDNKNNNAPLDILRNKHYLFKISKVTGYGYATVKEAKANPSAHVTAEITVTDSKSHDIISNGQYYLGVSNSEFVVYGGGEINNLTALTITTDATTSMINPGSIQGTRTITSSTGLMVVSPDEITLKDTQNGTTQVKIDIKSSSFNSGTITIKLGNLVKTIKVTRHNTPLSPAGGRIDDFADAESKYVVGVIEDAGADNWLRLSANTDGSNATDPANGNTTIRNNLGNIYPVFDPYIALSNGQVRTGYFYLSRSDASGGRMRVAARQEAFNVPPPTGNPWSVTKWIGTFHRHDEVGERIIYSGHTGKWEAEVEDPTGQGKFVVLSAAPSRDPKLKTDKPGEEPGDAKDYPVEGNLQKVNGTGNIYFRVGMTGKYTPTETAPCRYARIKLTHNSGGSPSYIYVRQGDAADYVMRKEDKNGSGQNVIPGGTSRPAAVKFSPYNLTDPNMGTGGSNVSNHNQLPLLSSIVGDGKNRFTAYPSQAGAFFQWAVKDEHTASFARKAYHPVNPFTSSITGWNGEYSFPDNPTSYWDILKVANETCPPGYRRPTDGSTTGSSGGAVDYSEMRQSLYLNPPTGSGGTNTDNSVWGYYADGFFDRRMIEPSATNHPNSAVSKGTKNVAYVGRLFYNPTTHASLFSPAAGYRYHVNGSLSRAGHFGGYWSSSADISYNGWSLYFGSGNASQYYYHNRSYGFSVRCVRP